MQHETKTPPTCKDLNTVIHEGFSTLEKDTLMPWINGKENKCLITYSRENLKLILDALSKCLLGKCK